MAPNLFNAAALALRASSAAICPALPTCPQNDQCLFTNNGVTLQVSCATDYYGGDVALAQASTLSACLTACSKRSDCVAASYVGQNCYLKSVLNPGSANANVIGVLLASRTPPTSIPPGTPPTTPQPQTCPTSFACPQDDGCSYTAGSRTLTLSCGVDFYGGDFANQYATSLEACTQACAANTECVAASFVGGNGAGTCYLKSTKNNGDDNDNVNGVYLVTASAAPSPSATSVTPTALSSTSVETISSTALPTDTSSSVPSTTSPAATTSSVEIPSSTLLSSTTAASSTAEAIPSSSSTLATDTSTSTATPTTDASSTALSSSTIASTTTTSATSSPSPASVIADGDFEATGSTPWTVKIPSNGLTYNFANPTSPHSGAQGASIKYTLANSLNQAWFNQPINLKPNTRYNFSGWAKATAANPGCNVYFYIGSADGNSVLKIMVQLNSPTLGPTWSQTTGFYDSAAGGAVTFSVRTTCSRTNAQTYYVDDLSLVAAA